MVNAVVAVLAVIAMLVASGYWVEQFETIGITSSSPLTAILTAFIIVAVITLINCLAVRRIVRKNFYD